MDKTLVTVKVMKESQMVLDWYLYVVSVSTEHNFSQIFEAISAASNHALNYTRFTEKLRIDDYKDGRIFLVQDISDMKIKIEVSWGLSVAECVMNFKFNHVLYSMTPKVQTKTVSNAYNLLKEGQLNLSLESVMDGMGTRMIYDF
jgi:uncharacterized protein YqgV (UPF0045/DUF77 family)